MLPSRIDKAALWKEHGEKFSCAHESSKLCVRTVKGGGKQYVRQCLRCGDAVSNPIKAEAALAEKGGGALPSFDEELQRSWAQTVRASAELIKNSDDSAFWDAYEKYLASSEWKAKRARVLERAAGVCEGCGETEATQIHHISYEHVGAEFLFELVAVCDACHERLHPE
jgi:5-methylcytosine-specific restriction endonuclease McrA